MKNFYLVMMILFGTIAAIFGVLSLGSEWLNAHGANITPTFGSLVIHVISLVGFFFAAWRYEKSNGEKKC